MTAGNDYIAQAAAIPYRVDPDGRVDVLLIRRKSGRKWGIPKGLVDPGLTHAEAAQMEAMEEAGIEGKLSDQPVGNFTYEKFGGVCLVQVYAMKVTKLRDRYLEQNYRRREWFEISRAAELVSREPVRRMIRELADELKG